MLLARSPWSGHYQVREALWGYAHYGQFTQVGWQYLNGGCGELAGGGSFVTLKSPGNDYSIIIETKDAKAPQQIRFQIGGGLSAKAALRLAQQCEGAVRPAARNQAGERRVHAHAGTRFHLLALHDHRAAERLLRQHSRDKPFPFPYYETFDDIPIPKTMAICRATRPTSPTRLRSPTARTRKASACARSFPCPRFRGRRTGCLTPSSAMTNGRTMKSAPTFT